VVPASLSRQSIGTVLGYSYPTLQPLFEAKQLQRDDARNQEQVLEKLQAGRNRYAVSNQWTLDWFNQRLLPGRQLQGVAVLQEQSVGCYVRNDPSVPVQRILRTLVRMKMSGEIDDIIGLYIGGH
jgi:polar amino acid transport system substrate-binding protein